MNFEQAYDFTGKTAVVTGGAGVLGRGMVAALVKQGARVAVLSRASEKAWETIRKLGLDEAQVECFSCDVMDLAGVQKAADSVKEKFGAVDFLINGAGGNDPKATTGTDKPFFDLPAEAFDSVIRLNLQGTVFPCQVFGRSMAEQERGVILNISSMNAFRPLTRIPAYSASKAALSNFTQWLAVHLAQEYSPKIRVNALAPGFFLTEQNRFLLTDEKTGKLTARGQSIMDHTPMARFGEPKDVIGAMLWLLSPAAEFVTGVVVPIDGGFSAFSGV